MLAELTKCLPTSHRKLYSGVSVHPDEFPRMLTDRSPGRVYLPAYKQCLAVEVSATRRWSLDDCRIMRVFSGLELR
jgi:hypothetical protein